jgi:hypothetical protein
MKLDLSLHRKQMDLFKDPSRFLMVCAGRRFGKTRFLMADIIHCFLKTRLRAGDLSEPTIIVAAPTLISAKRVLWTPLTNFLSQIPGVIINRSELTIKLVGHPTIRLASMEAGEGIRGVRILLFAGDEAQDYKPNLLDEVILPAMADTKGSKLRLTFTPKGKTNWLYGLKERDGWKCVQYKTSDNPFVPRAEIELAKKSLPPKTFAQEFEASWVSFSGQLLPEFSGVNILNHAPECQEYYMGVDWGDINPAVVCVGVKDQKYYVVHWKTLGDGSRVITNNELMGEITAVARKYNPKITFCDPSRAASIFELRQMGKKLGLPGMVSAVGADNAISPGVNVLNTLFFQVRLFVPAIAEDEVISYRRKVIKSTVEYIDLPEDNQPDHTLDALRYVMYSLYRHSKCKILIQLP